MTKFILQFQTTLHTFQLKISNFEHTTAGTFLLDDMNKIFLEVRTQLEDEEQGS